MNTLKIIFSLVLLLSAVSFLPANAQSFTSGRRVPVAMGEPFISTTRSSFDDSFDSFSKLLSSTAETMRKSYDQSCIEASKRNAIDAWANQIDTWTTAQQVFMNGQAQALNSGGIYNTRGTTVPWGFSTWGAPVYGAGSVSFEYAK